MATDPLACRTSFGARLHRAFPLFAITLCVACGSDPEESPGVRDAGGSGGSGFDASVTDGGFPTKDAEPDAPEAGPPDGFTRYAAKERAPITPSVLARAKAIGALDPARKDDVFIKVGASGTVNKNFLYCFAGAAQPSYSLELGGRTALMPSIDFFRAGDAAGSTPYDRATLAAKVGMSASWAIGGSPSPLDDEIQALNPRFAFVNYGTNDMGQGVTFASALFPFAENLSKILDQLEAGGIIPIVTGLNPRTDSTAAGQWVPSYDAVTRAMAEARQLPYLSLYYAAKNLPQQGMTSDGIHGNTFNPGAGPQPCVFTTEGLGYNYNTRNLLSAEILQHLHSGVVLGQAATELPGASFGGVGTASDPIVVDVLPFSHSGDTSTSGERNIASYSGCSATQDESGPEVFYALTLPAPTPLRIIAVDRSGVDVDVHLLSGGVDGASCAARNDRLIQGTFPAGTHHIVIDTFTSSSGEQSGAYTLVVLPCASGDPDCG